MQIKAAPAASEQGFAEAMLVPNSEPVAPCGTAATIDLEHGKRVSIFASVSPALAAAALKALR